MVSLRKIFCAVVLFGLLLGPTGAWAVSSSLWETDTRDDFEAGEPEDVSIMAPGQITLGPKAETTLLDALFVWKLAQDSKGRIYAATGNEGKIFRLTRKGEPEEFADLELQQVFALAVGERDVIYAGGFPGGKIYSITPKGEISEYYDTLQDTVWALAIAADSVLYAGTGDEGRIFKVESAGKGEVAYDSPERRILSLLADGEGNVFAGTEQNGIVYKLNREGRLSVLYDTELQEITSMTVDSDGNLYAVSAPGELFMKVPPPHGALPGTDGQQPPPESAHTQPPGPMPGLPAVPSPKKRACIIYKLAREGAASKFWTSPEKLIFSVAFDGENILAGSGDDGEIYALAPTGESGTYYKADQKQVLALHRSSSGAIIASTGNDAAVIVLGDGYSSKGEFLSRAHDATAASRWGKVFWEADTPPGTSVSIATRSGNSESPDDTWSKWTAEHSESFVSESPMARYVQWRATLATSGHHETPVLGKVTVAYLQTNLAPVIESVTVGEQPDNKKGENQAGEMAKALKAMAKAAGKDKETKASTQGVKSAPEAHTTKLKIQWTARDENDDTLEYELYFKGTDETRWKLLEDELKEPSYEWDTEAVPDGEYHVKVVAGDLPSNPEDSALRAERTSERFMIDNTSPTVQLLDVAREKGSRYRIAFTVSDNLAPVRSAHYSIDAGEWMAVFAADGIFDSRSEKVEFTTDELEKGEHTVVLKAVDYFGNVGAGKTTFVVK